MTDIDQQSDICGILDSRGRVAWQFELHDPSTQVDIIINGIALRGCRLTSDIQKKKVTRDSATSDMLDHSVILAGKDRELLGFTFRLNRISDVEINCNYVARLRRAWIFSQQVNGSVILRDHGVIIMAKDEEEIRSIISEYYPDDDLTETWGDTNWGKKVSLHKKHNKTLDRSRNTAVG